MKKILLVLLVAVLSSCATMVQLPKFTTIDKVMQIKPGMLRDQVELILGVPIYDLKNVDDKGTMRAIYKYRVFERKIPDVAIQPSNGIEVWAKWGNMVVLYSNKETVISFECEDQGNLPAAGGVLQKIASKIK